MTTLQAALVGAGILLAASPAAAESSAYTYDALGRVLTQTDADGTVITFSYDPAGNRTQRVTTAGTRHRPVAVNDTISSTGSTPVTFDPRTNDSDPDSFALTVVGVTAPAHGTTSFTSTSVTYTAASGYSGSDAFAYAISDGHGGTAKAGVTVNAANPTAGAFTAATTAGVAVTFDPRSADSDPAGYALTIQSITAPAHGTAVLNGGTSITYTPNAGYNMASDAFHYTIIDTIGRTATGNITVWMDAPPTANPYALSTRANIPVHFSPKENAVAGTFSSLNLVSFTAPSHGAVALSASKKYATYTPNSGYAGTDSFSFTITDGNGWFVSSTASVTVGATTKELAATFSASSTYPGSGFTGLTTSGGMDDAVFNTLASAHGTNNVGGSNQWIQADLGSSKTIDHITVARIPQISLGGTIWSSSDLEGKLLQYSNDGSTWTTITTMQDGQIENTADNVYTSVSMNGVSARYVRIYGGAVVGLGDFMIFGP
ncbi:Ig-like domain-containing protein [Caulobacter sp. KR2-114]|uniref:Ig-like domain-containing protein n=1 Tax=Caulobacter sp. KR2-114 TaxID=3400912 RepID=UPI003C097A69